MALPILLLVVSADCSSGTEEVTLSNRNCTLSGTLLTPNGKGPFAAVVFVHGSGPEERSNSKSRAKDFVRRGYAALIYDKRGVGKSGGNQTSVQYFSLEDLAGDVGAAVQFLSSRSEIDARRIGLVATSQGGWVAPLAASKNQGIAFLVIISGSVTTIVIADSHFG